jgi:hypothetical protein
MRLSAVAINFVLVTALFSTSSAPAFAQATSGNVAGTVKDSTGAVIPQVAITATNESTGVVTNTTSNGSGEYLIQNLPASTYTLKATATGFSPAITRNVHVVLNSTATANLSLTAGSQTTVEVTSDASAALDTTTQNLTTSFTNDELSSMPTATIGGASSLGGGQSGVLNVSLLSPGVASSGGLGIGIGPAVGGQRPRNNNFEIEGIDNNNKAVTGPLVYLPNDAVGNFTLITNQFSPEFGHSSGGQFNTTVSSGTNAFHGRLYEYFQNRNLNAASGIAGGKVPNPKYDNNRYGGQLGGPIFRDKLFFFANFERNTVGQNQSGFACVPTAAGVTALNGLSSSFSATNLAQYLKYTPGANFLGGAQVTDATDNACFNQGSGGQFLTVTNSAGASTNIPLGNYVINGADPLLFKVLTSSVDYNISSKDSLRLRYIYNTETTTDTNQGVSLPEFYTQQPFKFHLFALSEYHTFTPNLTNEFRIGFNRYENELTSGNFSYPGLDSFPTFQFYDQGFISVGPDTNAPQFTIQNLYQITDNISYNIGRHGLKFGFDGRKYISPQGFTQRARGDYEYNLLDQFLHDLAPDGNGFAERSSGNHTYYGDQTALYFYGNDTWRATPSLTFNVGLRYEFTSVPTGERAQALNSAASVPGLIDFHAPQPSYTSLAPRFGINWSPDSKTSVRAGFGIAYDVLFDNLGTLSFPPQYSTTEDVGSPGYAAFLSPNFLKNGGLPPGKGTGVAQFCLTGTGTGTVPCQPDIPSQQAATSAFLPDQIVPYAETYTLTVQRSFGTNYTAEIGYIGTRGIHLPTQDQLNIQPRVTPANQLFTLVNGNTTLVPAGPSATTLAAINARSNIVPAFVANGANFTAKITSYQPYSSSNYNGLITNLTRRFQHGLQMNLSWTWSKTMDDATAEVFATVLTPRRAQDSRCIACDYSRSALDRTHRVSLEVLYDTPFYKHSDSFVMRNLVGNWLISPIYTYESPAYATVLSGVNSNLNGDSGAAIDRPNINPNGIKGTGTGSVPVVNPALQSTCLDATTGLFVAKYNAANGSGGSLYTACAGDTIGYSAGQIVAGTTAAQNTFTASNAYYVQAGVGTLPTAGRNTLPIRPIDNIDLALYKRFTVHDHYSFEFGIQAFNILNHAQYLPGTIDNVNGPSYTNSYNFQTVTSAAFNHPEKEFLNNARAMQLTGKINF